MAGKFLLAFVIAFFATAAYANQYNNCRDCKIYYSTKRVVKSTTIVQPVAVPVPAVPYVNGGQGIISENYVYMPVVPVQPVPVPVPVRPAAPLVPVYNYVPTPEASNIYSPPGYPTDVPVAASRNCAMYVDPYDLFGQLFGGADLVQSCLVPAY